MNILCERMRRFQVAPHFARLWIADEGEPEEFFGMIQDKVATAWTDTLQKTLTLALIRTVAIGILAVHEAINAVEVVNSIHGLGSVVYRDWP